jgi:hypothetical protein
MRCAHKSKPNQRVNGARVARSTRKNSSRFARVLPAALGIKSMKRLVEIRSYKLKPGTGAKFHALVTSQSMPLLLAAQMDVVAYGQSLHDADSYCLIRSYESMEHLSASQEEFYSSSAWRQGPREAIISLIDADINIVLWLTPESLQALRESFISALLFTPATEEVQSPTIRSMPDRV